MKQFVKHLALFLSFCLCFQGFGQNNYLNYQGVARDASGEALANQQISLEFTIRQTFDDNTVSIVMIEEQVTTTDDYGYFQVFVGETLGPDAIPGIDWGAGSFDLLVEWDPEGGTDYQLLGEQPIMPVPLALHAMTTDNVDDADADSLNEIQNLKYDPDDGILKIVKSPDGAPEINLPYSPFIENNQVIRTTRDSAQFFVFGSSMPDYVDSDHANRFFFDREFGAFRAGSSFDSTLLNGPILPDSIDSDFGPIKEFWDRENLGPFSFASGVFTGGFGYGSATFGVLNISEGPVSMTGGLLSQSKGVASVTMGIGNTSASYAQTVLGMYADTGLHDNSATPDGWSADDYVFVLGNGTSLNNRSNALEVFKNGDANLFGKFTLMDPDGQNSDAEVSMDNDGILLVDRVIDNLERARIHPNSIVLSYIEDGEPTEETVLDEEELFISRRENTNDAFDISVSPIAIDMEWFVDDNDQRLILNPERVAFMNDLANTFIGDDTGISNTDGNKNAFFGSESGERNTTGSENTFIGEKAGFANTIGLKNVFVGQASGFRHRTGNDNVFIGDDAGFDHRMGSQNVYIGAGAGIHNESGSGNVFIGTVAGAQETGSNKLYINNDNGGPEEALIYGEFDTDILRVNGNLGIGDNPIFPLDVSGDANIGGGSDAAQGVSEYLAISGQSKSWFLGVTNDDNSDGSDFFLSPNTIEEDGMFHFQTDGKFGMGTNNPVSDLHLVHGQDAGNEGLRLEHPGNNNHHWTFWVSNNSGRLFLYSKTSGNDSGDYVGVFDDGSGSYSMSSDRRLKKDITELESVLPALESLKTYRYHYKSQAADESYHLGLMAQDVAEFFPELVTYDKVNDKYLLNYGGLAAVALSAVKEQQEQIDELKSQLDEVLQRLEKLETEK